MWFKCIKSGWYVIKGGYYKTSTIIGEEIIIINEQGKRYREDICYFELIGTDEDMKRELMKGE